MLEQFEPTEKQIHKAFVQYVTSKYPEFADFLIHIPNEGRRSYNEGRLQRALGLKKGASDLFFAKPKFVNTGDGSTYFHTQYCGLWLELKTKKGRETESQRRFRRLMKMNHYAACIAYGLDEAIAVFEEYIG